MYARARTTRVLLLALSLGTLLILAATATYAARRIVNPLLHLTEYADAVAHGNLGASRSLLEQGGRTSREVATLGDSIEQMVGELNKAHEVKIYAMQTEFEKNRIEEASTMRTQFFASMSHEIRTPMNAIMGISDILLAHALPKELRSHIKNIKTSSESLLVIINDILDISKIDSGKMTLVTNHFDLDLMLENVGSICRHLAERKGLAFVQKRRADVPRYFFGDEVRIRQVLLNLLGNAVKFTEIGSVTLEISRENNQLRFDITDTGSGIREEDKRSLFQTFKQLDQKAGTRVKGTGLGLAISRSLVTLMNGSITLDSIFGKGSSFHVRVPLMEGDPAQVRDPVGDADDDFRVSADALVVDDNEINLAVAVGLLKLYGVQCDTAASGSEAIEKVMRKDFDIVFMDHMMPEMDGVETTRAIRSLGARFAALPIVALTANAMNGVRELLFDASMNDYLSKPIEKRALKSLLAKWLACDGVAQKPVEDEGKTRLFLRKASKATQLDVETGLTMIGGDVELFQELLTLTKETLPGLMANIDGMLEQEDWKNLQIVVHGVKSSFASIGAALLSKQAQELEHALKTGDIALFRADAGAFVDEIRKLDKHLEPLVSS